ncbi:MAG: hypothetical protein KGL69_06860 [Alphaproteobacteria bacterium]|jgi:membrane protein implicated in regulation of membrane protease activity|nr:hypothetical protein [Alphaproteobacteria bacterium]
MLNRLLRRIALSLVAAGFAAGAVMLSVFAFGYSVFAVLRQWLPAAGASALTGVAFLILAGLALMLAPAFWPKRRRGGRITLDADTLRDVADGAISLVVSGLASRSTGLFRRRKTKT